MPPFAKMKTEKKDINNPNLWICKLPLNLWLKSTFENLIVTFSAIEDEPKARITCLERLNDEVVKSVASVVETNQTLQKTVNNLTAKNAELDAKYAGMDAKYVELSIAAQKKEADLREQQSQIANLTDQVAELSGQITLLNQRADEVEIENGAYYATYSGLVPKLKAELKRFQLDMEQIVDTTQKASKSANLAIDMLEKDFILPEFDKLKVNQKLEDCYIDDN